jgi:transposase
VAHSSDKPFLPPDLWEQIPPAHQAAFSALNQMLAATVEENKLLREQLRLLRAQLYGRSTERWGSASKEQILLPLELEPASAEKSAEDLRPQRQVSAYKRGTPKRRPLPEHLPREVVVHDIPDAKKTCACGAMKACIGQEESEQLMYEAARLWVLHHIRPKWACRKCEGTADESSPTVAIAPMPPTIIPKSFATASLLAHIITAKFVDALPLYRQERQFERLGVLLKRGTMCGWLMKVAECCARMMKLLREEILRCPYIGADETELQVLAEGRRAPNSASYIWVFRGVEPGQGVLIEYVYSPTRSGTVAAKYLQDYEGYVQTDAYVGYDFLDLLQGVVHLGCWAHARRGFTDVLKAAGVNPPYRNAPPGISREAVEHIRLLYAVEAEAREKELAREEIYEIRQEKSKPELALFKAWLQERLPRIPPKSLLGKAVAYTLGQWPRLEKYLDDGMLSIDNNFVENAIRPVALGRRNWLFAGTPEGAEASATLYSLVGTAKANGIEPHAYLCRLLELLPLARSDDDYRALLPHHMDRTLFKPP